MRQNKMIVIGVTGGVGAGKSTVLEHLRNKWGAEILRLDDVGREVLDPGTEGFRKALALFGPEVLLPDGSLDRKKVAGKIFEDESLRLALDQIVHPEVKRRAVSAIREACIKGTRVFVLEAALLIEDHYDEICTELWYIYADEPTRYRRLRESRGYSDERIRNTIAAQLSDDVFRRSVNFVVDNSGDLEESHREIDRRMEILL